ncbi:MAG: hypothetical protein A3B70_04675 [Deltaproteobacteria bacterium RIFCSPHIGHO2_02_FULL_40_11]|nr:MAG: hypothetical protein A3B70_04675 [Deltaproteobacteria bacterium RIFCSPHIGHO2_02_FULL_40_11]
MDKKTFQTPNAPSAIGPYSQAVETNGLFFCSGQIPIDPKTNQLIESKDIVQQTTRVLENIKGLLEAKGLTLEHVVKTTVFLKNMDDFVTVNDIYGKYFGKNSPARSAVEVSRLPKNVLIEIETIATLS